MLPGLKLRSGSRVLLMGASETRRSYRRMPLPVPFRLDVPCSTTTDRTEGGASPCVSRVRMGQQNERTALPVLAGILTLMLPLLFESHLTRAIADAPAEVAAVGNLPESWRISAADAAAAGLAGFPERIAEEDDFVTALAVVEARIDEVRAGLDELVDEGVADEVVVPYRERIERLENLRLLLQRRRTLLERWREVERAFEEQQALRSAFEERGLDREPPYSLLYLDQLRDDQQRLERDHEANQATIASLGDQLRRAGTELAAAQRARRVARDTWEKAADEVAREAAAEAFELTRLEEIVAGQRHAALDTQLEVARRQGEIHDARLALLADQIAVVERDVVFPEAMLEERLAELESRREQLEAELRTLRRTRNAHEGRLYDVRRALQEDVDEERRAALVEQAAVQEAWLEASSRSLDYLEQRLGNLAVQQRLWERRHALANDHPDVDPAAWLPDVRSRLAQLANERTLVETHLNTVRASQLDLLSRLEELAELVGEPEMLRSRLRALEQLETYSREYLASLARLHGLAERFETELAAEMRPASLGDWLGVLGEYASGAWEHELLVVQDRGIYVRDTVQAIVVFMMVMLLVTMARGLLKRRLLPRLVGSLERHQTLLRDVVVVVIRNTTRWFVVLLAFYAAMLLSGLAYGHLLEWLGAIVVVAIWLQVGWWAGAVLLRVLERTRIQKAQEDPSSVSGYGLLNFFGRVAIWSVVALSVLSYFEYPIAGLIGALGVGGIAVAFALQNILADIFNSMAIILDKPFRVGDFIIARDTLGVVEQIGIKTTRIRSLSGEQIVMTNTDVLGSRIRNYKRMFERRVVFGFGVVYQTPPEKLERIPSMIREIIEGLSKTRFDRAHFAKYGEFSLDFEIVYYVLDSDYGLYMDRQQAINLAIYRRFQAEGIAFAYPTQELIVKGKLEAAYPP